MKACGYFLVASALSRQPRRTNEGKLHKLLLLSLLILGLFAILPCAHAADLYWVNSLPATDWSTPENWGGVEPTAADNAYIDNNFTVQVTQPDEICNTLYLSGILNMTAGTLAETNAWIGKSGAGNFYQSGGTHTISGTLDLGVNYNAYYTLNDGILSAAIESVGTRNTSEITQSGGTNSTFQLIIGTHGNYSLSAGSLNVGSSLKNSGVLDFHSGSGALNAASAILDFSSGVISNAENASFHADSHSLVLVPAGEGAAFAASFASYTNDGILHEVGTDLNIDAGRTLSGSGTLADLVYCDGTLAATAGYTLNLTGGLIVGAAGTVDLGTSSLNTNDTTSGMRGGTLSSAMQVIGKASTGIFTQSAGTNTTGLLDIRATGTYLLGGGTLKINAGIANAGVFDFASGAGALQASTAILDFSKGLPLNSQNASLDTGPNCLTLLPVGASAAFPGAFAHYSNAGIVHEVGTALTLNAGQSIYGAGTIPDHVDCNGTLAASAGQAINLMQGVSVVEGSTVNLGTGELHIKDVSSQSGGSISCKTEYFDSPPFGVFTQTGGTHSVTDSLIMGWSAGTGTYNLSGSGQLTVGYNEFLGSGTFNQSGGTNTIIVGGLYLDQSNGSYNLTGGTLVAHYLDGFTFQPCFNFGGGTLKMNDTGILNVPMTLTGIGGDAQIDTAGYNATSYCPLSGVGGLKKLGSGELILQGENTFSGDTKIYAGDLAMNVAYALQNSTLDYDNYGGSLSFGNITSATLGGLKGSQNLSLLNAQSNSVSLTVGNNNQSTIYSGNLSGAGTFIKVGTGTLTLSGTNNFVGTTYVTGGTLRAASPNAISRAGSGTWVSVSGLNMLVLPVGGAGEWTAADIQSLLPKASFSTVAALGLDTTTAVGGNFTYDSPLSGNFFLVKLGSNSLTLSAANTLTGFIKINAGTLILANANALQNSTLDYNNYGGTVSFGTLSAVALGSLKGAQDLVLENVNSEPIALSVASVGSAANTYSGILSGAGSFSKISGTNLTLSGANTFSGDTTIKNSMLTLANPNALQNSTLDYNGNGGSLSFGTLTAATLGGLKGSQNLSLSSSGGNVALTVGGNNQSTTYGGILSSFGSLTKIGAGTFTLSGANTFNGDTKIRGGCIALANINALQNSPLDYNSYGGILSFGTLTAATLGGLKGNQDLALANENGDAVALSVGKSGLVGTYSGVLSGAGSLTKTNAASFTLAGANTFFGDTKITGGSIVLANPNALQNSTLDYSSTSGSLSFGTLTSATLGGLKGNRSLVLANSSFNPVTLSVGGNGQSATYSGNLSGSGSLTKIGSGTLTLTGVNNYSGITIVNGGALQAGYPGSLAGYALSSRVFVNSGGTLIVNAGPWQPTDIQMLLTKAIFSTGSAFAINTDSYSMTYDLGIGGNFRFIKSGLGTLTLTGTSSYPGGTTVDAGVLMASRWTLPDYDIQGKVVVNGGTLGLPVATKNGWGVSDVGTLVSHATFNSGSTLLLDVSNATAEVALDSDLGGNFNLKKVGGQTLTLSGALTYTGSTTIDSGTLKILTPTTTQATVMLHDISGYCTLYVGDELHDTHLWATSIDVSVLVIGAPPALPQSVPEPTSLVLLAAGLAALGYWRAKRKAK